MIYLSAMLIVLAVVSGLLGFGTSAVPNPAIAQLTFAVSLIGAAYLILNRSFPTRF